ncbi:MAG: Gfo/Idh/MocA family oxidoreductase [Actinobacteria bacterium]|nr:Gfo/Idh/MocA family oxidoreductase [Actinomycetota bacterium]
MANHVGRARARARLNGARSPSPEYRPSFPAAYRPGIGIIGCGGIVKLAHLPAYAAYGVDVVGVYDPAPEATRGVRDAFPVVGRVFESVDELLAQPRIGIVDIATHPAERFELVQRALAAGKHVLSQKPFALELDAARALVEDAERRGLRLAVNQNGRWSPPWRLATLLVQEGAVGEVCAVTHLYEHDFGWTIGDWPDALEHFVLYDFSVHWLDITRCWLEGKTVAAVRALEYRNPGQPGESKAPWGAWVLIECTDGTSAAIRSIGTETQRPGNPFWIHGTEGTIRGSVRKGTDFLELERGGTVTRYALEGEWLPDGFAGTLAELCTAIAEDREPFNSARHNLLSLELTLAACRSAEQDGAPVVLDGIR